MTTTPSVEEILTKCAAAYANCRTYQDTGEGTTMFVWGSLPWNRRTERHPFRTFFQRPAKLYFEFRNMQGWPEREWGRAFVVANAQGVFHRITMPEGASKPEAPHSLHEALRAVIGQSGGTSGFAPWLLLPCQEHSPLPFAKNTTLIGQEDIDGHRCYRLRGHGKHERVSNLWIEVEQFLLRRETHTRVFDEKLRRKQVEQLRAHLASAKPDDPNRLILEKMTAQCEEEPLQHFITENVTTFSPRFDVDIDPSVFEFHPPDEAT